MWVHTSAWLSNQPPLWIGNTVYQSVTNHFRPDQSTQVWIEDSSFLFSFINSKIIFDQFDISCLWEPTWAAETIVIFKHLGPVGSWRDYRLCSTPAFNTAEHPMVLQLFSSSGLNPPQRSFWSGFNLHGASFLSMFSCLCWAFLILFRGCQHNPQHLQAIMWEDESEYVQTFLMV